MMCMLHCFVRLFRPPLPSSREAFIALEDGTLHINFEKSISMSFFFSSVSIVVVGGAGTEVLAAAAADVVRFEGGDGCCGASTLSFCGSLIGTGLKVCVGFDVRLVVCPLLSVLF